MATKQRHLRIKDLISDPMSNHNWRLDDYDREWAIGRSEALYEVDEMLEACESDLLSAQAYEAVIELRRIRARLKGLQGETQQTIAPPPKHV